MIAIDTSALVAILLREAAAKRCAGRLEIEADAVISAGTLAEALIVAGRRGFGAEMMKLVDDLGLEVISVTTASARRVAEAHERWGRGSRTAGLNFGDCFAYEVAKAHDCPLLFVGDDFSRTDLESAL